MSSTNLNLHNDLDYSDENIIDEEDEQEMKHIPTYASLSPTTSPKVLQQ